MTRVIDMQRRQFLGLVGFLATPFELMADNRKPTPEDVEGPFYPIVAIPMRSDLVRVSDNWSES
jgi:protocatechuate 3,4-dioxygenase beta subunit